MHAEPFCKPWLGNSASFLGIFTLSNWLFSTKISCWILGSCTWWGGTTSSYFKWSKCLQNFPSFLWPYCSYTSTSSRCNVPGLTLKLTGLDQLTSQSWQIPMPSFLMALILSWALELRSMADPAGCQTWHKGKWIRKLGASSKTEKREMDLLPILAPATIIFDLIMFCVFTLRSGAFCSQWGNGSPLDSD